MIGGATVEIEFVAVDQKTVRKQSEKAISKIMQEADEQDRNFTRLVDAVERLKRNIERYSLEALQTQYKKGYEKLTDGIVRVADSWAMWIWKFTLFTFPRDPDDATGNEEMNRVARNIITQTRWRGKAREKYVSALLERQDVESFCDIVCNVASDIQEKAFRPYWRRHCRKLESDLVWNDIYCKIWIPTPASGSGGYWTDESGEYVNPLYPP